MAPHWGPTTKGEHMKNIKSLQARLHASDIQRWHTARTIKSQSVGEHTYRALQLLRYIAYPLDLSSNTIFAMLDHDVPEVVTGDVPFSAKREHSELKFAVDAVESIVRLEFEARYDLTPELKSLIKQADLLEMAYFGLEEANLGNKFGGHVIHNIINALMQLQEGSGIPLSNRTVKLIELISIEIGAEVKV